MLSTEDSKIELQKRNKLSTIDERYKQHDCNGKCSLLNVLPTEDGSKQLHKRRLLLIDDSYNNMLYKGDTIF